MHSYLTAPFRAASWTVSTANDYLQPVNRAYYAGKTVTTTYSTLISTAMAAISTVGALISFPTTDSCISVSRYFSTDMNNRNGSGLSTIFFCALRILNPSAHIEGSNVEGRQTTQLLYIQKNNLTDSYQGMADKQIRAMRYLKNGNWFNRHITTRLAAPVMAVAFSVAAIVRIVIGVVAAAFAFLTLGLSDTVNTFAYNNLAGPGFILNQLQNGVIGIFRTDLIDISLPRTT